MGLCVTILEVSVISVAFVIDYGVDRSTGDYGVCAGLSCERSPRATLGGVS